MTPGARVIVIGLDGLEPTIVERMLTAGELPHLGRLRASGGYARVATTTPAQTPVAWSTFATGVNPGGHGIFDFLRRDPLTYFPDLAFSRYEQKSAFLPPRAVNLRRGVPLWEVLSRAGIPSTVIRCPCTYPPDELRGRMLSGMGVPDIRGGLGTSTFYSTAGALVPGESEQVVRLTGPGPTWRTSLVGPRDPKTRSDVTLELAVTADRERRVAAVSADRHGRSVEAPLGAWSDWLRVKFRTGPLASVSGAVRFLLVRLEPELELYASPVNFDPAAPPFPISHPWDYAGELAREIGLFHTTGMVEDHGGLHNGRFGEAEYLAQCEGAMHEREQMLEYELGRFESGFLFCLFDTPDRVQHMFWRFREPSHPANRREPPAPEWNRVIEDHYRRCDDVIGRALRSVNDRTLLVVLSDHGFNTFQRGVHLNAWLQREGYLTLRDGVSAGEEAGEFLQQVDWGRTTAYALGLGSMYLNVKGREAEGVVDAAEADDLAFRIARGLGGLVDPDRGTIAVRAAHTRRELYSGPCAADSPDIVVDFAAGYRVSWTTALGGVPGALFEDNTRKWGGDHIVDPVLVPGVLFMNQPFDESNARLLDLAPTVLGALGVAAPGHYEGRNLRAG